MCIRDRGTPGLRPRPAAARGTGAGSLKGSSGRSRRPFVRRGSSARSKAKTGLRTPVPCTAGCRTAAWRVHPKHAPESANHIRASGSSASVSVSGRRVVPPPEGSSRRDRRSSGVGLPPARGRHGRPRRASGRGRSPIGTRAGAPSQAACCHRGRRDWPRCPEERGGLTDEVGALVGGGISRPGECRLQLALIQDGVDGRLERDLQRCGVGEKRRVAIRILGRHAYLLSCSARRLRTLRSF